CAQRPPPAPAPPGATPPRPCRVLVIDDEADVAETLRRGLALFGHTVDTAASGAAGIEAARRSRPDIVLCDLGMAEMDGYVVAGKLRRELGDGHIPLIAYSGSAPEEPQPRPQAAGFTHPLPKPLDLPQLQQAMSDLLAQLKT